MKEMGLRLALGLLWLLHWLPLPWLSASASRGDTAAPAVARSAHSVIHSAAAPTSGRSARTATQARSRASSRLRGAVDGLSSARPSRPSAARARAGACSASSSSASKRSPAS